MFAQVFRLLSVYSLIKPRRGSNVEGVEILNTILNFKDVKEDKRHETLCLLLDKIRSDNDPAIEHIPTFLERVKEHDQRFCRTPEFVQALHSNVQNENRPADDVRYEMIDACNRGRLKYPSNDLYLLVDTLENIILHILAGGTLNCDTFYHIVESIKGYKIPLDGCSEHRQEFPKSVVSFYLITRSHFVAKRYNTIHDHSSKKSKKCRIMLLKNPQKHNVQK